VNGQPVDLAIKGQFETKVAVPPNATSLEVVVRAEDSKGFDNVVVKRLSR